MAKIGIFGGTFNPPHRGHILAAREVRDALTLDQVIFIPAAVPPHKALPEGSPSPEMRMKLVEAAIQGERGFSASDLELNRPGKSYTSDTLRELKAQHPGDTLYLITGNDMFLTLDTWHQPERICAEAVIVGVNRKYRNQDQEMAAQKEKLQREYGAEVIILENRRIEISSSRVRRMLVLGGAEHYIPEKVMELILKNKLYGTGRDYRCLPVEELEKVAVGLLKAKRVNHVRGCAETAVKLAQRYGGDPVVARRAGLLHDVTKAIDGPDQLLLVDKYDIIISDFERRYPKLLHAKTGAAVAKYVFGENDQVVEAICWHTTGKADMSLMEKIVYIADYMEPNRNFPGVEELREAVFRDLDQGLLMGLEMCIEELIRENKPVCKDSADARDYLRRQLKPDDNMEG